MSNLEKEIANKNKQSNKEKKHAEKVAARTKRQEYIENTIEAVKSNTTDIVATSFEILKDYIKETKQNHQTIDAAKNRYEDYINFANTYQNFPVTYTNENGENVTVVQTENGPIFKTEHHTPEKYDRFSTYELITYEGFHSTEIKGKPQLVYSCLTNNICFEPSYVDHDYDKMTMISGVTRTPYGKFNIVETDTFEYHNHSHNAFSRYNDNDNTPSYEEKMLNSFLSLEETFNNALEASMVNTTDPEKELAD